MVQKFKEHMAELGLPNGVEGPGCYWVFGGYRLILRASSEAAEVAACRLKEAAPGGTQVDSTSIVLVWR